MAKFIKGKRFGDKGYLSKILAEELWDQGVQLITRRRRHLKPVILSDFDKLWLRNRSIIETINDQLQNISQLKPSRHRSLSGLMLNLVAALMAYSYQPNKPSFNRFLHTQARVVFSDNKGSWLD